MRNGLFLIFLFLIISCSIQSQLSNLNLSTVASIATPTATPSGTVYNFGLWNSEVRAVRIFFLTYNNSNYGSFDPVAVGAPYSDTMDYVADRFYSPSNDLLSGAPPWLQTFEIKTNGAPEYCAQFETQLNIAGNCHPTVGTSANCGAPVGQFRVSEVDCVQAVSPLPAGIGSETDGLYMRAIINRKYLAPYENLLMILEYTASTIHLPSTDPSTCFVNGQWTPENCVDFLWSVYLRHSTAEMPNQPFLMLVPPLFLFAQAILKNDTQPMIATKQVVIPLAMDSTLSIIQISRQSAHFQGNAANLLTMCATPAGGPLPATGGVSPLCAGMIFNTETFYRI